MVELIAIDLVDEVSTEEAALGFAETEAGSGVRAIAVSLGDGLRAVKLRAPDGTIQYAVCDERFQPLYTPARTLEELRKRFFRHSP
jgi:hypothetical protein